VLARSVEVAPPAERREAPAPTLCATLFAHAGWSKDDLRGFVFSHAVNTREALAAVGKDAVSGKTRWRLSSGHTDSIPDSAAERGEAEVKVLNSEQAVQIVVVGAHNAGVSAVIETFGPRGGPPATASVESPPAAAGSPRKVNPS
jgi:hypothetical protein